MKIKFLVFLLIVGFIEISFSQSLPLPLPKLKSDWERVYIKDLGSFDLPPTMEIQEGQYRAFVEKFRRIYGIEVPRLVGQPKGINKGKVDSREKYARIVLEVERGDIGYYDKLQFDISEYSKNDIAELDLSLKEMSISSISHTLKAGGKQFKVKLIKWYPVKLEKINGMSCIHLKYIRQLNDSPQVMVDTYIFQNSDRLYRFTISYRISEENYWKKDLEMVLNSFRVTNIK